MLVRPMLDVGYMKIEENVMSSKHIKLEKIWFLKQLFVFKRADNKSFTAFREIFVKFVTNTFKQVICDFQPSKNCIISILQENRMKN